MYFCFGWSRTSQRARPYPRRLTKANPTPGIPAHNPSVNDANERSHRAASGAVAPQDQPEMRLKVLHIEGNGRQPPRIAGQPGVLGGRGSLPNPTNRKCRWSPRLGRVARSARTTRSLTPWRRSPRRRVSRAVGLPAVHRFGQHESWFRSDRRSGQTVVQVGDRIPHPFGGPAQQDDIGPRLQHLPRHRRQKLSR